MGLKQARWISLALFAATVAVYAPVISFEFVNFDDPDYVKPQTIADAFTSTEAANWFPVTRLSHLLDLQLFGMNAGAHHLMNVLYHALAAVLLFAFLNRATKAVWPSTFVAAVFALHPLHVESVAWIAERKDVLSALFFFLTLYLYARYIERPTTSRYLETLAAFTLGLMAKPMLVTLPFVLLLLDIWPFHRKNAIREKIPFFALSAIASLVTYQVQHQSGAVESLAAHPLSERVANAIVSYGVYLANTIWPVNLAVFYPYPQSIPTWQLILSAAVLLAITVVALRKPYLTVGWLWYLGTLVPVIGLVQVGAQARADRYTYIPMVGLAIMLAWAIPKPATLAIAPILAILTFHQLTYWQSSETLFRHALEVTTRNDIAEHNLGSALLTAGRLQEATTHLQAALAINPNSAKAHTDLGSALAQQNRFPEAIAEFQTAIKLLPDSPIPRQNLAQALTQQAEAWYTEGLNQAKAGDPKAAIQLFESALQLNPNHAEAHNNLGVVLTTQPNRQQEAIGQFEQAVRLDPNNADAQLNLGIALANDPARTAEALQHLEAANRLHPDPQIEAAIHKLKSTAIPRIP